LVSIMSTIDVIGFGALNMDHLYRVKQIVLDGEVPIDHVTVTPGGSAANTIYGLAKLGVRTGFVGAIGDDVQGKASLSDLQSIGVDTTHIRIKKAKKPALHYVSPMNWEIVPFISCLEQIACLILRI